LVLSYHALKLMGTSFLLSSQIRRKILSLTGDEVNAGSVLGANFSAGFVAGTLAAAATCPLDVARTRRQIEVIFPFSGVLSFGVGGCISC